MNKTALIQWVGLVRPLPQIPLSNSRQADDHRQQTIELDHLLIVQAPDRLPHLGYGQSHNAVDLNLVGQPNSITSNTPKRRKSRQLVVATRRMPVL